MCTLKILLIYISSMSSVSLRNIIYQTKSHNMSTTICLSWLVINSIQKQFIVGSICLMSIKTIFQAHLSVHQSLELMQWHNQGGVQGVTWPPSLLLKHIQFVQTIPLLAPLVAHSVTTMSLSTGLPIVMCQKCLTYKMYVYNYTHASITNSSYGIQWQIVHNYYHNLVISKYTVKYSVISNTVVQSCSY